MAIPIILCGKYESMGEMFKEAVQPDIEVTKFISSPEEGLAEIPQLMNSASSPPQAVVVGATYDDAWIGDLQSKIPGLTVLKPNVAGGAGSGAGQPSAEMAKVAAQRAVGVLNGLKGEGKLGSGAGGVVIY
ncbi:hypothetical protein F5Y15DRAFT_53137 [Xylariaceae sp. FL0016]|nr:hypothetical protein F5Y15DRAFT_53137 [Xylariaceae sp. FL0016]